MSNVAPEYRSRRGSWNVIVVSVLRATFFFKFKYSFQEMQKLETEAGNRGSYSISNSQVK